MFKRCCVQTSSSLMHPWVCSPQLPTQWEQDHTWHSLSPYLVGCSVYPLSCRPTSSVSLNSSLPGYLAPSKILSEPGWGCASVTVKRKYSYHHTVKSFEFICSPQSLLTRLASLGLLLTNARNTRKGFKWKLLKLNQASKYISWHLFKCDTKRLQTHRWIQNSDYNYHEKGLLDFSWHLANFGRKGLFEAVPEPGGYIQKTQTAYLSVRTRANVHGLFFPVGPLQKTISFQLTGNFPWGSDLDPRISKAYSVVLYNLKRNDKTFLYGSLLLMSMGITLTTMWSQSSIFLLGI